LSNSQTPSATLNNNIVSSYTTTIHQNQVLDLPAYPTFSVAEQASASFDAPIYGPHLQPDQYISSPNPPQQTQQQQSTHQQVAQQQTIEYVEPIHPAVTDDAFNQEQQHTQQQLVAYGQEVIDNAQTGYANEIGPSSETLFGQNEHTFVGDAEPNGTEVNVEVEGFQDNSFGQDTGNIVFEGPENVVYQEETNNDDNGNNNVNDGDPVAVEQTAQVEGYHHQNEGNNNNNGNGLVQENDNTAPGDNGLFHEYNINIRPPGGFDDEGDGEYAHLIPPPPEPEEGVDNTVNIDWNNGTDTASTVTGVTGGFEEDTLGELDIPAKKRRFNGMQHIFGGETTNNKR